jgi:hypothetical protein
MRAILSIIGTTVLSLLLVVLALPSAAGAQDATPASTAAPLGGGECTVDPIDPATYGAAALSATPQVATPEAATGEPANGATVFAVYDTIVQSIACTNAGDLARLLAVIDPSYAQTLLGVPADQVQAAIDAAVALSPARGGTATPLVDDNDQSAIVTRLVSIGEIVTLPDGQVAATVGIDSPQTGPVTTIIYLSRTADRYLITNYVFVDPGATPAA